MVAKWKIFSKYNQLVEKCNSLDVSISLNCSINLISSIQSVYFFSISFNLFELGTTNSLLGQKLQHLSNDAFQSYYDFFQVN